MSEVDTVFELDILPFFVQLSFDFFTLLYELFLALLYSGRHLVLLFVMLGEPEPFDRQTTLLVFGWRVYERLKLAAVFL